MTDFEVWTSGYLLVGCMFAARSREDSLEIALSWMLFWLPAVIVGALELLVLGKPGPREDDWDA